MSHNHKQDKQCKSCMETLPIGEFYRNKNGLYARCKTCTIEHNSNTRDLRLALGPRRPKKKVSLYESNHKLLSGLGPGERVLHGRYVHTYKKFSLYLGPEAYILDGELLYGEYNHDDVLHTLHTRHMKLISRSDSDEFESEMRSAISLVRNACGVPIEARFLKGLVSLDQYFLWMDAPRKLLISEAAEQVSINLEILNFLLPAQIEGNQKSSLPGNIKNTDNNSPQVIDNTTGTQYEYTEE